ncbi:B12-binding domain-containing radical SAM protein [Heliobacterium chlorum]|uniref:B12-binding domain-containing radical SAM protein n=1 Tax=Heliobacterium chlorum TaxID=2698 RepID=A0ABR7T0V5_HELCL|nr:radical SAM protein [Heliobacterium chlorum]MBC9784427.1 B12-binding domain-containing radical SAM protein [Heliobacterium chlorum]
MRILLIAYDNDSYITWFPQGLAYIAKVCQDEGAEVEIYNQDMYHWPESHLLDKLNREKYDVIGVSVIGGYYQYRKLLKISDAINQSKNRPFYIIGGHGPAPEPEYFLQKTQADVVVIGEGERTIKELLEVIQGQRSLSSVDGIAYFEGGQFIKTKERELLTNIDHLFPSWDIFPINYYSLMRAPHIRNSDRWMPVLSGRGCPFTCNFCYRMDKGFRARSPESILEEIGILSKDYGITYIGFSDELLMSSEKRTIELCEAFIKSGLRFKWNCNGRLNYAKPDVLRLMKEAGCLFINYGIESMDEKALKRMNKALTVKQIVTGIENTLAAGISPGYNIIFGNIGENEESLRLGVEFLLKYDDHSQLRTIRPVTPYPGSPLYYYAIEKGLLKDCQDFYENKHTNSDLLSVNFTELSDADFHRVLYEANKKLMTNYYEHKLSQNLELARKLYFDQDASFRGFRQT